MNIEKKEVRGKNYFNLAMLAFAGLGIEMIYAYLLEPALYGGTYSKWNEAQHICHWIMTCISWGGVTFLIIKYAHKKYGFNIFESKGKIKLWQWILTFLCIALVLVSSYIDWNGSKVIHEFKSNGLLKFIFQYIYYLFETGLFLLIIVFGQKSFEKWFHKENIPYGGIVVALTWGMGHWLTKGTLFAGLFTAACGFCFGVVYLLLNRNIKWSYLVLCIMFMF
jgi:hypothetical protein